MISVVIPTHNRKDLLSRAIKSAQAQTYSDLEIIIISDGSNDGTDEVVKKLVEQDVRIRFEEYTPGRGGNYARNLGIQRAKGEYIAFLDDDDVWYPDKLKKQINALEKAPKAGLCYTGVHIIYVDEHVEYDSVPREYGNLSKRILLDNCIGTTSTVLVKKVLLEQGGGFDEKLGALQDFELWIRLCQITEVAVVAQPLICYYNYRNTAQISNYTDKYIEAFQYINTKHKVLLNKLIEKEKKKKNLNELYLIANKAMRNNDRLEAKKYTKQILSQDKSKKAIVYYTLSFLDYKIVLKLRKLV